METEIVESRCGHAGVEVKITKGLPDWSVWAWSDPTKVLYGPVPARRLGASLGVNLFPHGKFCSFKCVYCDLDIYEKASGRFSLVPAQELGRRLATCFEDYAASGRALPDSVTFAGNGEPTFHPGFHELARRVQKLRDETMPTVPLNLFTNGLHLGQPDVLDALTAFRRIFIKLDGSTLETLERLNGPGAWQGTNHAVRLAASLENASASTMVVSGSIDNTEDVVSSAYAHLVGLLNPREVYLYTLDYPTRHRRLQPVSLDRLVELAETVSERIQIPIIVLWREHRHPSIENRWRAQDVAIA